MILTHLGDDDLLCLAAARGAVGLRLAILTRGRRLRLRIILLPDLRSQDAAQFKLLLDFQMLPSCLLPAAAAAAATSSTHTSQICTACIFSSLLRLTCSCLVRCLCVCGPDSEPPQEASSDPSCVLYSTEQCPILLQSGRNDHVFSPEALMIVMPFERSSQRICC